MIEESQFKRKIVLDDLISVPSKSLSKNQRIRNIVVGNISGKEACHWNRRTLHVSVQMHWQRSMENLFLVTVKSTDISLSLHRILNPSRVSKEDRHTSYG